ncbi:MAG: hypothetical protein A3F73_00770 [Gallionellales bacterium RIFCSPLOWO2_12_FULL_59_22]|nr:MAG: hypothetical protein A3H99_05805 [Gallionellales bacterium RIFCSPLOWO2_02_FULL_59_110]OGT04583.1 MAG: hypothetical protein A2Z65_04650 [Gallionellales bacterium RIFCSPLOWO2_02_58_13]OGT11208.1 MAG: hypothetical protein A3F73_00770 [Gallionellales bacterium RIFCSPLOWO2_12_FULL_59_22]
MAVKPSPRLAMLLLLSHALAATVAALTAMPLTAMLAIFILILLSLLYYLARDVLLLFPGSWQEVLLDRGGISIIARDGSKFSGRATARTFANPCFAVLHIMPEGCHRSVSRVIFPDAVGKGAFRELNVHLRFAQ